MTSERFNQILEETLEKCKKTLGVKAGEYATADRLHNFKVAAELQNCTPMTALAGMMAKHTVSVYDLIGRAEYGLDVPLELWDEKIGDHINYLILLSAMVRAKVDEMKKTKEETVREREVEPGDYNTDLIREIVTMHKEVTNIQKKANAILMMVNQIKIFGGNENAGEILGKDA